MTPTYLIFAGEHRFPVLGWEAYKGQGTERDSVRALLQACRAYGCDWYQIVDATTWTVLESGLFAAQTLPGYTAEVQDGWQAFLATYRAERAATGRPLTLEELDV